MANKLLLKKSSVAAKVPLSTDLEYGELALNYTDGKLYYKTDLNAIASFNAGGGASYTAGDGLSLTGSEFAVNNTVVRTTGTQSIGGQKTFTDSLTTNVGGGVVSTTASASFSNGTYALRVYPRLGAGSYNPIVQTGDTGLIFNAGASDTGVLVIAPWASSSSGLRMTATGDTTLSGNLTATTYYSSGTTYYLKPHAALTTQSTTAGSRVADLRFDTLWKDVPANSGPILTYTLTSGGTGYTDGSYTNNVLSGGQGINATFDFTVAGGIVTVATLTTGGSGFQVGNTITIPVLGGTGSGGLITINTVRTVDISLSGTASRIRLASNDTTLAAGQEIGGIYFNTRDGSNDAGGDNAYILATATATAGGTEIQFWTNSVGSAPTLAAAFGSNNDFKLYNSAGTFYHSFSNAPTANRTLTLPDTTGTVALTSSSITGSAATLTNARTLTVGSTGKTFNGSANVSWSLAEIGAYAATNPSGYTSNTGSVTSISTGTGLTGGPITTSGTISLANTAVTAGSYTNPSITVDAQGRITSAANGTAAGLDFESYVATAAQTTFAVTYTAPYVIVVVNGAVLHPTDYTATSGTTVVLATACAAGDIVLLQGFQYISAGGGGGGSVDLSSVAQNIVPSTDITYDLGSSTKRWRDLYLSGSTINLGGALIKADATSGSVALVPAPTVADPNPTGILVSPAGGISVVATTGGAISSQNFADALANSAVVTDKITLQSSTLQTAAAGTFEYDGKVPYFTPQGTQRGIVPGMQYYRLNSDFVGANVNTAQSVLGVGVELSSNTVYHFEAVYSLNKSAGTTAHTKGVSFGGTATLNNIAYQTLAMDSSVSYLASVDAAQTITWVQSAANSTVVASSTAAGLYWSVRISGTVSVSAGGTFIPQYTLSAAPGGAYSTSAGSYFLIYPIGVAGSNTSIGSWA